MKQEIEGLLYAAQAAWHRRAAGLVCAWLVLVVGWVAVSLLPDKYESRAMVYVDTVNLLKPLLQGIAVSSNAVNEADIIRRALLARASLERVVKDTDLSKRARTPEDADRLLTKLAQSIVVSGNRDTSVYYISYSDHDPVLTQAVVQHLLNTFVTSSMGADKEDAASARKFLGLQVADYEARLAASEQRLAEFKKKNLGVLANSQGDSFQRLQSEQLNLEKLKSDLSVAEQQRDELRRQIGGSGPADGIGGGPSRPAPQLPTDYQIQTATALDARIQENQRQLDELLLKYTDQHPDVISLRATIAALEQRRRTEFASVRPTTAASNQSGAPRVDNVLQDIQIQLNAKSVQIAALQEQVAQAELRLNNLRAMLGTGPQVEAELAGLNRDYGVTKAEYEQLLQRLESAKISGQANATEGVTYRVLDPPRVPLTPTSPKRGLLMGAVLILALGSGVALSWVLSQVRPAFMDVRTLREAFQLPVLGAITFAPTDDEIRARRRHAATYAVGLTAWVIASVLAVAFAGPAAALLAPLASKGGL